MIVEKSFTEEDMAGAVEALAKLQERPKRKFNGYDAVKRLYTQIIKLRQNGYTYEDISKTLNEAGVSLSVSTIKRYVTAIAKTNEGDVVVKIGNTEYVQDELPTGDVKGKEKGKKVVKEETPNGDEKNKPKTQDGDGDGFNRPARRRGAK